MRTRGKHPTSLRRALGVVAVIAIVATACDPGKVTPTVGTGASGNTGDGGPATDATFQAPGGIVAIPGGGYYVVDDTACVIRKVDADGTITTVAGTGTCGYSGDGGPAMSAEIDPGVSFSIKPGFYVPVPVPDDSESGQVALDSAGNLYLVDSFNGRIRRIDPSGTISTVVSSSVISPGVQLGRWVTGTIALTADDTLYLAGGNGVSKVGAGGTLTQVYSTSPVHAIVPAPGGDLYLSIDGSATGTDDIVLLHSDGTTSPYATSSHTITNLAVAPDGTLYGAQGRIEIGYMAAVGFGYGDYSSLGANRIVRFGPGTETWIAGAGAPDPGTAAQTGYGPERSITPEGLAVDANGSLLYSSGHVVYTLNDPSTAGPWTGTACSPSIVHPGADLSNADLTGIDLRRCDLSGVNLTDATLLGAELDGSRGIGIVGTPASLPAGYGIVDGVLTGSGTDYSGANLDGLDLTGADFSGADLTRGTSGARTSPTRTSPTPTSASPTCTRPTSTARTSPAPRWPATSSTTTACRPRTSPTPTSPTW